jgi:hypothetical protein
MKSQILAISILFTGCLGLNAQDSVNTFNYQGVLRDPSDHIIANRLFALRLFIQTPEGEIIYGEEYHPTTSNLGLFDVEVGSGPQMAGTTEWKDIDWISKKLSLKLTADVLNGQNFSEIGESPIRSVPVANEAHVANDLTNEGWMNPQKTIHSEENYTNYEYINNSMYIKNTVDGQYYRVVFTDFDGSIVINPDVVKTNRVILTDSTGGTTGLFGTQASGQSYLYVNQIESDTIYATKVFTTNVCTQGVMIKDEDGNLAGGLSTDEDGNSIVDADQMTTGVIGADTVHARKVSANAICADRVQVLDADGVPQPVIALDIAGNLSLSVDKVYADNICTEDFSILLPNGNPLLEVDPEADPGTEYAFMFNGNVMVNGGIMAQFKNFVIDHPLDPEHKNLRHFSIESDQMANIYSGTISLDEHGEAWVQLPDWFEALNKDFSYQLTCIGGFANVYIGEEINQNRFKIAGGREHLKVSWQVTGIRHDKQALENQWPVEEYKSK